MAETHEGGWLCGSVRYQVVGNPNVALVCHCTFGQRRTGSAFGVSAYFDEKDVTLTRGVLNTYKYRSDERLRWMKMEFCPTCGTTVTWTAEVLPGTRSIAVGTLDDPNWLKLTKHAWTRSAQHWTIFPADVERIQTTTLK
jgi:hypothetical protein